MKIIQIKKKRIFKISAIIVFLLVLGITTTSIAMQHYYKLDFSTGLVTASVLNVRSGPGTKYKVVTTVKKNDYIRVFAGIGNWYVVQVEGDYVGVVSKEYIKHPSDLFSVGDIVDCYVDDIALDKEKVSLSLLPR